MKNVNVWTMIDSRHNRLKSARESAGFDIARQAAAALRIGYPTYAKYENGQRDLTRGDISERLARAFKVEVEWLLFGRGDMRRKPSGLMVVGRVGAGAAVEPVMDAGVPNGGETIDLPNAEHLAAAIVVGDSQMPRYRDGEAILFDTRPRLPEEMIGRYAVCDLADGRRLVKIIRQSGASFRLESHNADPEEDVHIIACYAVEGTLSAYSSPFVRPGMRPLKRATRPG